MGAQVGMRLHEEGFETREGSLGYILRMKPVVESFGRGVTGYHLCVVFF